MKKSFIITIDTEGDNIWKWTEGESVKTENALFIPRFQELCERYRFIPTYLCNREMAENDSFVKYISPKMQSGKCEVGMHLHAWNTPPEYDLPKHSHAKKPYLIEYPEDIMEQKIVSMTALLEEKFNYRPVVHRAGRWAMDDRYFKLLHKHGYIADCSVTPYVSWKNNYGRTPGFAGTDYSQYDNGIKYINNIIEVPVSIIVGEMNESDKKVIWLRPNGTNMEKMLDLVRYMEKSAYNHLEFMIHSSELMPGGSPTFPTEESIEKLYKDMTALFEEISRNYEGAGLEAYCKTV